jgi:hypothetical protein
MREGHDASTSSLHLAWLHNLQNEMWDPCPKRIKNFSVDIAEHKTGISLFGQGAWVTALVNTCDTVLLLWRPEQYLLFPLWWFLPALMSAEENGWPAHCLLPH